MQVERVNDDRIDELEAAMINYEPIASPLITIFTKGLYSRGILMPKAEEGKIHLITSKIHKTQHQFFVMKGVVDVSIDGQGWERIEAPYWGITEAGTRRILKIIEDTTWITVHPLEFITGEENNLDEEEKEILINELEDILIERHENKLISHTKTLQQ